jgi:ferritin-like metal-binding protein YciE
MKIDSMEELLLEELKDLYDAEKQLVRALPKFVKAASDEELGSAFRHHLDQTKGQVERLEQVFDILGAKPKSKACKGMKGVVEEVAEVLNEDASESLADSAMIGAAKKVEHYEIAAYDNARMLAQAIGKNDAAQLLQQTLGEEDEADRKLTQIAKRLVKEAGRVASSEENGSARRASNARSRKTANASKGNGHGTSRARQSGGRSQNMTTDHEEDPPMG